MLILQGNIRSLGKAYYICITIFPFIINQSHRALTITTFNAIKIYRYNTLKSCEIIHYEFKILKGFNYKTFNDGIKGILYYLIEIMMLNKKMNRRIVCVRACNFKTRLNYLGLFSHHDYN